MTEKQQLLAMLDRAGVGYGRMLRRFNEGETIQVEAPHEDDGDEVFYVADFDFDNEGKLENVFGRVGEKD